MRAFAQAAHCLTSSSASARCSKSFSWCGDSAARWLWPGRLWLWVFDALVIGLIFVAIYLTATATSTTTAADQHAKLSEGLRDIWRGVPLLIGAACRWRT
jgi:hypothetical protein